MWDHLWYNKQERDNIEKAGEPWELSGNCWNSLGSEALLSTIVYVPLHLHRQGLSSGAMSYLKNHCNMFLDIILKPILVPNRESKHDQQGITIHNWPPYQTCYSSVGQCSSCLRHLLDEYQPAKATWHTQPTQKPLFQHWRDSCFV